MTRPIPHVVVMLKEPRPGRVKTRLGRDIGMAAAACWFRHQAQALIRRLGRDPRFRLVLAVSPDVEGMASRVWPGHLARLPQGQGDLGRRMARAMAAMPPGPVAVIGADVPGISPARVVAALQLLRDAPAVIGPAEDGGYWLIALRRGGRPLPPGLFAGVRWSTRHALADTLASLAPLPVARAATLADIDTAADLARAGRRQPSAPARHQTLRKREKSPHKPRETR